MKFTTTLAVASLLSAAFVAATPIPYEDELEVAVRDFEDFEVDARDFEDFEVDARDFDDYEVDAREFDDEDLLYLRSGLGKAFRKAAKDTADIAASKAYEIGTSGGSRVSRPGFASTVGKPAARPRPAGGVRPIKAPGSTLKAPGKTGTNWKAAWDAAKGKGKAPAAKPKKARPVLSRPAKHVARPGGHAGKPVKFAKKGGK